MLRLADALDQLSLPALKSVANELLHCLHREHEMTPLAKQRRVHLANDSLELECRQLIRSLLTASDTSAQLFTALTEAERQVLLHFILYARGDFISSREVEQRKHGQELRQFRLGLTGLRRKGLLYTSKRQWGEVAYFLPEDLNDQYYSVWLVLIHKQQPDVGEEEPQAVYSELPFWIDLYFIVDNWRFQPSQRVPTTQKWTIQQRIVRQWEQMMPQRQASLAGKQLHDLSKGAYTDRLAILLDYLNSRKLIQWYASYAELNEELSYQFMGKPSLERVADFLQYWSTLRPVSPWLVKYKHDVWLSFAERLSSIGEGAAQGQQHWFYALSFVERWEEYFELPDIEQLIQELLEEVLLPLAGWGLLEIGQTEHQEWVWRFKITEEQPADIWLQPGLELYVPANIPLLQLWQLSELFRLDRWQPMLILELSKERVVAFAEQNKNINAWKTELQAVLAAPLPQDFEDQIQHWLSSYKQVQMAEKTLIDIEDRQLADALMQWPEVQEMSIRQLTDSIFAVDQQERQQLLAVFHKYGIQVNLVDSFTDQQRADQPQQVHPPLISAPQSRLIKVESVFPAWSEAIPEWDQIPVIWKKHLAAYHQKTVREIVQTAVQNGLLLKLEIDEGEITVICPQHCSVEAGVWTCLDDQGHTYDLKKVMRIQLLFPH